MLTNYSFNCLNDSSTLTMVKTLQTHNIQDCNLTFKVLICSALKLIHTVCSPWNIHLCQKTSLYRQVHSS